MGDDQGVPIALSLNNLGFVGPGQYVVACLLDGEETARAPFRVALTPPQAGAERPAQS